MARPGEREPILQLVTGMKGIGKSNTTIKYLSESYCRGGAITPGRKVLIFDFNDEYGATEVFSSDGTVSIVKVPLLGHDDIAAFSNQRFIEMRRIVPRDRYGRSLSSKETEDLIMRMMTEFRGGCLFIEDLNTVFGDSIPQKVAGCFTNNRHRDCDILLHVQSIGRVIPKQWQNTNILRVHKELSKMEMHYNKIKNDFLLFKLAQLIIDFQYDNGNTRYYLYVDKDARKIRGQVTQGMFDKAVIDYLQEYPEEIRKMEKMEDIFTGKKVYTRDQVLGAIKEKYSKDYFGNKMAA